MHKDMAGDPWYFADINPPEYLVPGDNVENCIVWVNVITQIVYVRRSEYTAWHNYSTVRELDREIFMPERIRVQQIREVMGVQRRTR